MLEKVRNFLGLGKANAATLIRDIVKGDESQEILFEEGNEHVLAAYVEFGHKFSPLYVCEFLETADSKLVKTYLEMGFELDDKAKETVLARKDGELTQSMIDSGSWAPFPFGGIQHSHHAHHEYELDLAEREHGQGPAEGLEHEDIRVAAAMAAVHPALSPVPAAIN